MNQNKDILCIVFQISGTHYILGQGKDDWKKKKKKVYGKELVIEGIDEKNESKRAHR